MENKTIIDPFDNVQIGQYWISSLTNDIVYIEDKQIDSDGYPYVVLYSFRHDHEPFDLETFITRFTPYK